VRTKKLENANATAIERKHQFAAGLFAISHSWEEQNAK